MEPSLGIKKEEKLPDNQLHIYACINQSFIRNNITAGIILSLKRKKM
jgi:hypothetical protein